jgi:serine/threonine protein kinase
MNNPSSSCDLSVGSVICGYKLMKSIDNRDNSRIFASNDPKTSEKVCLKFIDYNKESSVRVDGEIKMLQSLNSPFIIKASKVFDYPPYKCVVMPLAKSDIIQKCKKMEGQKLPESTVKVIAIRILNALKYLHSQRICHRDIKPENILVLDDKNDGTNVKLADLGFAKQLKADENCTEYLGTLDYAAPEIINGIPYNESIDIWSLGVTLFTLLSGKTPFPRVPEVTLRYCISRGSYMFPANQWKGISEDAKDLIKHMIQVDPIKRWTPEECLNHRWLLESHSRVIRPQINTI